MILICSQSIPMIFWRLSYCKGHILHHLFLFDVKSSSTNSGVRHTIPSVYWLEQAAVRGGMLTEEAVLAQEHISLNELLSPTEIGSLLSGSVELLAFCDEEGIRSCVCFEDPLIHIKSIMRSIHAQANCPPAD